MNQYARFVIWLVTLLIATTVFAAPPEWKIVPGKSSITFTATQNGSPVSGSFKTFTGDIHFDPEQLAESKVKITIDMASVNTSYSELTDTLITPDWFNVKLFPKAIFETSTFTKTGDKSYTAKGNLTIRDKTMPIILQFTEEKYSANQAQVKGYTTLKRSAFGVGQGEWASTNEVKDEVKVDFVLTATK